MFLSCHVQVSEWIHTQIQILWIHTLHSSDIEYGFTLKGVCDMTSTYSQMHRTDNYSEHSSIIWPVWLNSWVLVHELSGSGFKSSCRHLNFRFCACFEQGVPWLSGTIECGFTLKGVCDMTRTYSQMHCTDKYSEHSSIILASLAKWWSVCFHELSGSGFKSSFSQLLSLYMLWKLMPFQKL